MVAGGGASVVYSDAITAHGFADKLANYGEYSGAPTEGQIYEGTATPQPSCVCQRGEGVGCTIPRPGRVCQRGLGIGGLVRAHGSTECFSCSHSILISIFDPVTASSTLESGSNLSNRSSSSTPTQPTPSQTT